MHVQTNVRFLLERPEVRAMCNLRADQLDNEAAFWLELGEAPPASLIELISALRDHASAPSTNRARLSVHGAVSDLYNLLYVAICDWATEQKDTSRTLQMPQRLLPTKNLLGYEVFSVDRAQERAQSHWAAFEISLPVSTRQIIDKSNRSTRYVMVRSEARWIAEY